MNYLNVQTTTVKGTKTWVDGGRVHDNSQDIELTLSRKAEKAGATDSTVDATPVWVDNEYTYSNLDKYDMDGYLYTYTVTEAIREDLPDKNEYVMESKEALNKSD